MQISHLLQGVHCGTRGDGIHCESYRSPSLPTESAHSFPALLTTARWDLEAKKTFMAAMTQSQGSIILLVVFSKENYKGIAS